jgi:hypothetical protein
MAFGSMRSTSRRHWSWLLWLGLLFAIAQTATSVHAISHVAQDKSHPRDGGIAHAQCDLCLIGASIGGAAPAADPLVAMHPAQVDVPVALDAEAVTSSALALAYRSRAPPAAPR